MDEQAPPRMRFESALMGAEELRAVLRRREREGGSVALNIVLEGLVSPAHFAAFLVDKTGFSPVSEAVLERVTLTEVKLLPNALLYDGALIPLGEHDGHMLAAMCDPSDEALLSDLTLVAG